MEDELDGSQGERKSSAVPIVRSGNQEFAPVINHGLGNRFSIGAAMAASVEV